MTISERFFFKLPKVHKNNKNEEKCKKCYKQVQKVTTNSKIYVNSTKNEYCENLHKNYKMSCHIIPYWLIFPILIFPHRYSPILTPSYIDILTYWYPPILISPYWYLTILISSILISSILISPYWYPPILIAYHTDILLYWFPHILISSYSSPY